MPEFLSVGELFEQVVARQPNAIAVQSAQQSLTYDQLNRVANRIARAILARRGDVEEPVALLFDKNVHAIAAMLGILKAGKFYVPLDTSDPPARHALMLADSGAPLLLTDSANLALASALVSNAGALLNVDELGGHTAACPYDDSNLEMRVPSSCLMYLLYTSGSSGAPKGIPHRHSSLVKSMLFRGATGFNRAADRQSLLYSLSAATSVSIIFGILLNGGTCCIYDLQTEGIAGLADWLRQERITIYQSTPTVFRHLVATLGGPAAMPDLRTVSLNGEAVLAHDVALFQKHFAPPCRLRVAYGSTEARTVAMWYADHQTRLEGARAPVGTARGDARVFIWDDDGKPVPSGTLGEIIVQSDMLTPGYWRRPELDAANFLPDPEGGDRRLFRTGDLGILRSDGLLEYHGRKDDQVKMRGYRVEPEEIESALLALHDVREAAVLPQMDANGETRLVAYVVGEGCALSAAALRSQLARCLPDYMLPALFVPMDALPLTAGGKVDRRALSTLELPSPAPSQTASIAPFPSRIDGIVVPIQPFGTRAPFFCVHGEEGGVLDYGPLASHLDADQPFYALQSPAMDGSRPAYDDFPAMARDYVRAIREIQPRGPYRLGGYCFGGMLAFAMARELRRQGEQIALLAVFEGSAPGWSRTRLSLSNPRHLARFARNLPYWLHDYARLGARGMLMRARRTLRARTSGNAARPIDAMVDDPEAIPAPLHGIIATHDLALRRYEPDGPFDGTLTLFRVRSMSLLRPHDRTKGWSALACRVQVHIIPGAHNTILAEPDARALAASLDAALTESAQQP